MARSINDRMELIVKERFNGNKAAFAKAIEIAPTAISSYLGKQRRSKPSVDMVTKIVTNLGIDARWLLIGDSDEDTDRSIASGNGSIAVAGNNNITTNNVVDAEALHERIALLEKLVDEKERLINILMNKQ